MGFVMNLKGVSLEKAPIQLTGVQETFPGMALNSATGVSYDIASKCMELSDGLNGKKPPITASELSLAMAGGQQGMDYESPAVDSPISAPTISAGNTKASDGPGRA